jgi:hypothetical protein
MNNAHVLPFALLSASALFPALARADDSQPTSNVGETAAAADTPPAPAPRSLPHRHDGFYLHLSTGFGPYNESISRKGEDPHTTVSGVATTGDFAIGGSPRPGLVLGGAIWSTSVLVADARTDAGELVPPSAAQRSSYSVIGPWMDYYFRPDGGLHMPASLGFAVVRGLDAPGARFDRDNVALGAGFLVGLGYEWWVSDEWSVGILGRLSGIIATSKDDDGRRWFHAIGSAPSVLFTATYN